MVVSEGKRRKVKAWKVFRDRHVVASLSAVMIREDDRSNGANTGR